MTLTDENIYQMNIECNDMYFDICINEKDLMGVPEVGTPLQGIYLVTGQD